MAQIIDIPGQGQVEFPDEMKDADIVAAIHKLSGTAPKAESGGFLQGVGNLASGAFRGASNIGATLISPIDKTVLSLKKKAGIKEGEYPSLDILVPEDRRATIESALKGGTALPILPAADTESLAYKSGQIGAEIAGTAGVGGPIGGAVGKVAPRLGRAIGSSGFNVGGAPAATIGQSAQNAALRVGGGAITGGASAGMINPEDATTGAALGGAFGSASPILGKVGGKILRKFAKPTAAERIVGVEGVADDALKSLADDAGIAVKDLSDETVNFIKQESAKAFQRGEKLDAAALLREKEFQQLGIKPLQGQITRDPTQYAQELNLRGASQDISGRLREQNQAMQRIFGEPAQAAQEAVPAGRGMMSALQEQDDAAKAQVNALYQAAKGEGGRFAAVDAAQFSKSANDVLDEQMLGRFLPEQARGLLNDISAGKVPLNVNNLVQVDSVLSAAQRAADDAGAKAIGVVRDALHNAPIESTAGAEAKAAFDTARQAARGRFAQQDAIPALKAVVQGKASPDTFVRKFITGGQTDEVKRMADMLRKTAPEQFDQAKAQVAEDIRRAAFGEGLSADAAIRPEMLAKKLRDIGTEKMGAFFSPEEIERYKLAAKVATYIGKHPNAAPVNTSNTFVAQIMNSPITRLAEQGVGMVPGTGLLAAGAKAATGAVKNEMAAAQAMKANIPVEKLGLSESQRELLSKILGATGSAVAGQLAQ